MDAIGIIITKSLSDIFIRHASMLLLFIGDLFFFLVINLLFFFFFWLLKDFHRGRCQHALSFSIFEALNLNQGTRGISLC